MKIGEVVATMGCHRGLPTVRIDLRRLQDHVCARAGDVRTCSFVLPADLQDLTKLEGTRLIPPESMGDAIARSKTAATDSDFTCTQA